MVRTSKSTDKPSASAAPAASVTPAAKAAAPATESKPRAKKAKAEAAPVVAATPVVAASTPASTADAAAAECSSVTVKMTEYAAKLQQLAGLFATVKNDFKTMEKVINREMKSALKASSKKRRSNGNRKPSGFIKPTRISDELAAFLGKTVGTEMARTEVSREINAYIVSNKLQDKDNGRKINADTKLATLLKLNTQDELTYFNLQRYMKHHFIKAEVAASTA